MLMMDRTRWFLRLLAYVIFFCVLLLIAPPGFALPIIAIGVFVWAGRPVIQDMIYDRKFEMITRGLDWQPGDDPADLDLYDWDFYLSEREERGQEDD